MPTPPPRVDERDSKLAAQPQPTDRLPPGAASNAALNLAPRAAAIRISTVGLFLGMLLLIIRAKTVGYWLLPALLDWSGQLFPALMTGCYDMAFLFAMTAGFVALLLPGVRKIVRPRWVYRAHLAAASFTFLVALANIPVVPWLGQPFTLQWLNYSDFFRNTESIQAVLAVVPPWTMGGAVAITATFAGLSSWLARRIEEFSCRSRVPTLVAMAAVIVIPVYFVVSRQWLIRDQWDYGTVANPVVAFADSFIIAARAPKIFSMPTPYGPDDFVLPVASTTDTQRGSSLPADHFTPHNVVFFVFESTAAAYVDGFGGKFGVTPNLDARRSHAAIFPHAYAHAPATNLTLISLLTGYYPRVSYRVTTAEHPDIALPRFPARLRAQGYATGFFSSAPLDFQRASEFLHARSTFDTIEDNRNRHAADADESLHPFPELAGTDDATTVDSMIRWIDSRDGHPFFAVAWTVQTHYPYAVVGAPRAIAPEGSSADFNRYLNALEQGDRAFGHLMDSLDKRGLADDTLVVVLGDHGEAFGQHDNHGHAGHVFEENLHIPLLLINPKLFHGETHDTLAGVTDILPTVAEILRQPINPAWQGRSLFSTQRTGRVYFFAAWSDFNLGFRDGNEKFVYDATSNSYRVFDLSTDPDERHNLGTHGSIDTHDGTDRLAAWVQHVEKSYQAALMKH